MYIGNKPIANMTPKQQAACEAAARHSPDPSWHDGILRTIRDHLDGDGPWSNPAVDGAIKQTLADLGVASVFDLEP
jgi:hypothetical protein